MVVQDDYITIKAYKPPPQQIVSGKKRWHEALAEAAQHQPRGSGYLNDEQRECMMRCMAASRRTFRDVAMSVYGGVFSDVAQFLDGGRRRRSVWQRAREKLASSSVANAAGKAMVYRQPHSFSSAFQQETLFDRNHTGDTSTLLPCAVIYPNMHPTDRPELLKFLLSAVQQHQAEQPLARGGGLPLLGCTIRSTRHTTLASILRDLYLQIMAAVASMPVKARGQRKGAQRFRVAAAPQGTLGEVILAYRMLVDELLTLQQSSSSGAGVGARAGGTAAAAAPVGVKPCPSLLLMFEDVEALNNRLLEDLLRLLAEASESLPARLVFLVSPAFSLAQNLGNGATATLEPSTFILPPAHVCFEKLLQHLFLDVNLPVMVSGQVLRFFRVTFSDLHSSIITFIRHLDFMLRVHFTQLMSLLCMMPYDLVSEEEAPLMGVAAAVTPAGGGAERGEESVGEGSHLQEDGRRGGGGGGGKEKTNGNGSHVTQSQAQVLVLTKAEGGINDSHNLMVLRHLETLTKNPALRALLAKLMSPSALSSATATAGAAGAGATAAAGAGSGNSGSSGESVGGDSAFSMGRADDRTRHFQCLRILVHHQLAGRFELRLGCHLIHQVLQRCHSSSSSSNSTNDDRTIRSGSNSNNSKSKSNGARPPPIDMLILLEILLDHERPQRWEKIEALLWDGMAALSLEGVESLVLAWLELLRVLVDQMPPYVRRFSKAINDWIVRVRDLWLLLKALGKEVAKQAKRQQQQQQQQRRKSLKVAAAATASAVTVAAAAGQIDGGGGEGQDAEAATKAAAEGAAAAAAAAMAATAAEEEEKEEEAHRLMYRTKQQGITIDAQSFLADIISHCTQTLAQSSSFFKDAFWYRDSQAIQEVFFAQPRASAVRALNDSQSYLRCACCRPGELDPSIPDICIVYGLYEAHQGRTINLRAWFASFVDVICGQEEKEGEEEEERGRGILRGRKKFKKERGMVMGRNLKALWARFLHAVDELEHLGFTRPYGKKTGDRSKLIFAYTLLSRKQGEQEQQEELLQEV